MCTRLCTNSKKTGIQNLCRVYSVPVLLDTDKNEQVSALLDAVGELAHQTAPIESLNQSYLLPLLEVSLRSTTDGSQIVDAIKTALLLQPGRTFTELKWTQLLHVAKAFGVNCDFAAKMPNKEKRTELLEKVESLLSDTSLTQVLTPEHETALRSRFSNRDKK